MKLNNEIIFKDIAGFEARIAAARTKLAKLQDLSPSSWKERKRLKAKRLEFEGEIVHVSKLRSIAQSALKASESQPGQP